MRAMAGTIIIYGGAGGVGAATARKLAAKGYHLHLVGRDEGKVAAVASALQASMTIGDVLDDGVFESLLYSSVVQIPSTL